MFTNRLSLYPGKLTAVAATLAALAAPGVSAAEAILEELVVTAQKREQNLQDVPIAISAFGQQAIENIGASNVDDLGTFSAGIETNNNSVTQAGYTIRGINSDSFTSGTDPSAAVYVDGVYTSRGGGALVNFSDIERVEILRGPQGTLFGRNAAPGAISIITKKPSAETEGSLRATLGNANKRKLEAAYNTALGDDLFMRASVAINKRDGLLENAAGGADFEQEDDQTYRVNLLWNASDRTQVIWRAEYNEVDQDGPNAISTNPTLNPGQNYFAAAAADTAPIEERDLFGTSLEISHDLNSVTFTSISSYRTFNTLNRQDDDGSNNPNYHVSTDNVESQEQFSQEFRFTSTEPGPLQWTAGLNYFQEDLEQEHFVNFNSLSLETYAVHTVAALVGGGDLLDATNAAAFIAGDPATAAAQTFWTNTTGALFGNPTPYTLGDGLGLFIVANPAVFGPAAAGQILPSIGSGNLGNILGITADPTWNESTLNRGTFESWAVYGDATYSVTERLDLTFGARYTYDQKDYSLFSQFNNSLGNFPAGLAFSVPVDDSGSDSWSAFSPRLVLSYEVSEDLMAYGSVTRGFKSGGFNSFSIDSDGDGVGELSSFDEETVTNIELGIKSTWLDNRLMLNATVFQYEYDGLQSLDLTDKFDANTVLPVYAVRNADTEGAGIELEMAFAVDEHWSLGGNYTYLDTEYTDYQVFAGEDPLTDDKTGEAASSVPHNKLNLFVEFETAVGDLGTLRSNLSYNFTDDRVQSAGTTVDRRLEAFELVNARVTFASAGQTWEAALWANNLLDEEWLLGIGGTGEAIGSAPANRADPRTYGVDFIYNF